MASYRRFSITPAQYRIAFTLIALMTFVAAVAWANVRLRFPQDILPDFYTSVPVDALHNDEWAAIPFWRPPECVPATFNLLEYFDADAVGCPLLVEGFVEFNDVGPLLTEARGLGAVPVWFVRWSELEPAVADGVLTIGELASLGSLQVGTARMYNDQNHIFGIHRVSHFALVARGTLEDGRSFALRVVEVDLRLIRMEILFE